MNIKKLSISKPIVSISEICQMLQLSRSRYYQLINSGFFPKPKYDDRSKRPYYDIKLQQEIVECRQSGIGSDGSYLLFYSSRTKDTTKYSKKVVGNKKTFSQCDDISDTLKQMGLDTTVEQVQQGLIEIYPDGIDSLEQGIVIRELFRYLKSK